MNIRFFLQLLILTIFIFIVLEDLGVVTFYNVFNVNHAEVADSYIIFINEFLHFTLFAKIFIYHVHEISAYVCFYCLVIWWVEPQYFSFSVFTFFSCGIILIDVFDLFAVSFSFKASLYTHYDESNNSLLLEYLLVLFSIILRICFMIV